MADYAVGANDKNLLAAAGLLDGRNATTLEMERSNGRFARLLEHVRGNLTRRHSVTELAEFCCKSPRHFARVFRAEMGITPAKAVERLRLEAAHAALESGARSDQLSPRA